MVESRDATLFEYADDLGMTGVSASVFSGNGIRFNVVDAEDNERS